MISMQRSLSSPVRIRSSPPVSPTVEDTPRAPTTPIEDHHVAVRPSHSRSRSPVPVTKSSQNLPLRRSEDVTRKDRRQLSPPTMSSSRRPVVEQRSVPSPASAHSRHGSNARPVTPPTRSENSVSKLPKNLLQDPSMYTNAHLTRDDNNTTLEELAHIVRFSKFKERKCANTRTRLQRTLVSTALSARLTRCGEIAHRNLVDCFRRDDKDGFAALYNAIHDVRRSCDERRRYSLFEPDMQSLSSPILGSSESLHTPTDSAANSDPLGPTSPFLQDISASARDTLLDFLSQIRTNPEYLATRICALSSSELKVFLSCHKDLEPVESVLPSHGRAGRTHGSASARNSTSADIERLLSFQRHDPLSILIHACFANSAGPDSSEDQRRTDIWATVMARLIMEFKSSGEHFMITVLNIWTTMRDWSGKSNMEWYLMKILKDGAFLLELAEDQHGTRFNLSDWNQSDELAEKRFYDKAVEELFELVDDEDATGIPEGLLELGNAILGKLDSKYCENASRWLVWRCLFFVFFLGVIIHPESYGMLVDYHITPYAREKILKKVAMKAHEYVSSMWSGKPSATDVSVEIPPAIKGHLENVLARFQGSRSKVPSAKLLPARSITSLRETVEVHPYLVISPADLVTLVNALFPERRPMSSASFRSGSASLSNLSVMSQPIPTQSTRDKIETPSVISTSAGSVVSDATTFQEGSFNDPAAFMPQRYSPPSMDPETIRRQGKYEDDGYKLRLALHELQQNLGHEATRGSCHPCAERWMVLFVSVDGKKLTTQMTYDPEDDHDDDEDNSSTTDTDEDDGSRGAPMDKDYLQLRDSILKLVEDYEIPHNLEPETPTTLSNRASGLKRYKSKNKIITTEKSMASRNPYRNQVQPDVESSPESPAKRENSKHKEDEEATEAVLITMLKSASSQSKSQADFVSSHMYWKALRQLDALESPSLSQNGFAALINIFARGPKDSIRRSTAAIEEYDAWLVWLKQSQERHEGLIDRMMRRVRAIRDKMWYVTDVRNSKVYEHSRKVCQALKAMGTPRRTSFSRSRASAPRGSNAGYLYRAESQIMDLLAATEDQGGPNKLSDDQAEKTSLWLQQRGIANLCAGEERLHRFSYEVDQCISMLIGETIREAPVLWSSELYKRDKIVYDRLRAREREQAATGDDAASIISDSERRYGSFSSKPASINRDLRNISLTTSGHSFDSRHGMPRASAPLSDILDGHDYFDRTSPIYAGDNMSTFWTPFQPSMSPGSGGSRAYSPTTSLTNLSTTFSSQHHHTHLPSTSSVSVGRPGTSASSTETIFQQRAEDEKTRFLNELRQALTSLLLSDLGSLVLAKGSETDAWFEKIGQQCIERKDALDKRAKYKRDKREKEKERERRNSTRPRTLEKKKSFRDLRGADNDRLSEPSEVASGLSTPTTAEPVTRAEAKAGSPEFPFKKAYQRLLNMFCVHPDPFAKLKALSELENLILASLTSKGSKRPKWNRSDAGSSAAGDNGNFRPAQLEGTIDNLRERRSQALHSAGYGGQSRSNAETRSIMSGAGQTDAITKELQALFRDPSIRPKSLFRDLQFIASFVPASVLDRPERGNAFWNTGLAALKLKSEVCRTMMEMADEVVAAHTQHRKATNETAKADIPPSLTGTPPPPSTSYRLEDAGSMWAITAKEGYPTAQRELGLFYMSNPEFVERTTLPLSKPREVFKQTVVDKYGRGRGMSGAQPPGATTAAADMVDKDRNVRNDPGLMCVAFHWMEAAERGGDEVATDYMRQKEFMDLN